MLPTLVGGHLGGRVGAMKQAIKRVGKSWAAVLAAGAVSAVAALPASAQTVVTDPDYVEMVNTGKSELFAALTTVGPVVFGLLGVILAIRWAWSKFSRAASG